MRKRKSLAKTIRLRLDRTSYREPHRQILERDGCRCQGCISMQNLQVRHLKFRSKSGGKEEQNLIYRVCSLSRGDKSRALTAQPPPHTTNSCLYRLLCVCADYENANWVAVTAQRSLQKRARIRGRGMSNRQRGLEKDWLISLSRASRGHDFPARETLGNSSRELCPSAARILHADNPSTHRCWPAFPSVLSPKLSYRCQ